VGKNKINSANYESFYLDYLEGNLGENDTLDLFAFLNENPHLQVEEDMPVLTSTEPALSSEFKNLLKTDLLSNKINWNNFDFFLIARLEGQLNTKQEEVLNLFLEEHPELKKEEKLYAATILAADKTIVFKGKSKLKQKGKVILWPYFSAAAAACAVMVLWLFSDNGISPNGISVAHDGEVKTMNKPNVSEVNPDSTYNLPSNNNTSIDPRKREESVQGINNNLPKQIADNTPAPIKQENNKPIKVKIIEDQKLDKITLAQNQDKQNRQDKLNRQDELNTTAMNTDSYGMTMKDVAPPVMRKLSEMIKTEVNMKRGKDEKANREGVFFKIGSFEYYRNRKSKE